MQASFPVFQDNPDSFLPTHPGQASCLVLTGFSPVQSLLHIQGYYRCKCKNSHTLDRDSSAGGRTALSAALSGTILLGHDGIYDPNDFNDRLLLGLKGTMSEAELHFLHDRMRGGALNKAGRGELRSALPVGFLYDGAGKVMMDPDLQIQRAVSLFFESFQICGFAHRLATYYSECLCISGVPVDPESF